MSRRVRARIQKRKKHNIHTAYQAIQTALPPSKKKKQPRDFTEQQKGIIGTLDGLRKPFVESYLWYLKPNGNYRLRYQGLYVTIFPSQFRENALVVGCNGTFVHLHNGRIIRSLEIAKDAAFDLWKQEKAIELTAIKEQGD